MVFVGTVTSESELKIRLKEEPVVTRGDLRAKDAVDGAAPEREIVTVDAALGCAFDLDLIRFLPQADSDRRSEAPDLSVEQRRP